MKKARKKKTHKGKNRAEGRKTTKVRIENKSHVYEGNNRAQEKKKSTKVRITQKVHDGQNGKKI